MRIIATLAICLCIGLQVSAQYRLIGFVYDAEEEPFIGIEVRLRGEETKLVTFTDQYGGFEFTNLPRGTYHVVVLTGYGLIEREINLRTSLEMHLQRPRNIRTDEVVVSSVRAEEDAPLTFSNVTKEEIGKRNLGQDVPYVLGMTPSVVETSDAGTGFGYTGLRIRGTDPTRINVTINGVPLNDAESQSVYWVDLPDLLSSTNSIQIQRGVGSSTFGAGAFGASVNLNTVQTKSDPHAAVSLSGGSFNTYRASLEAGTGLIGNHFTIDGRVSLINSDGYIDRASADLKSWFATAAYITAGQSLRLNAFGGHEVTYQAWNGVPAQYIDDDELRTYNTAGTEKPGEPYDNEVDDYKQTHFQLLWNASVFTQLQTYATLHYTRGKGFYEQYKGAEYFDNDFANFLALYELNAWDAIRRRWLDNDFYGAIAGFHFFDPNDRFHLHLGGAWHRYTGDHFGEVIWSGGGSVANLPDYYRNDAKKRDASSFLKLDYSFNEDLSAMLDLQLRGVKYQFEGPTSDGQLLPQEVTHTFLNPKFGLNWQFKPAQRFYGFFGVAHREPNRDDYVASTEQSRPAPEKLLNTEVGWEVDGVHLDIGVNAYHMYYLDQLVLTGRINDVGEYTRQNVDKSYRLGLELTAKYEYNKWDASIGITTSRNRVKEYEEFIDNWDNGEQVVVVHEDAPLAFSPGLIAMGEIGYHIFKDSVQDLRIGFEVKHVGKQYTDNTDNNEAILDAYTFADIRLSYSRKIGKLDVTAQVLVRNVFDALYSSNAWLYRFRSAGYDPRPDDPYAELEQGDTYHLKGYYPQAGRNVLAGITVRF